jgi:hypothetical protein
LAGHWWLTPVILATLEAEIRRMLVRSQPWQVVFETLSQKKHFTEIRLVQWLKMKALRSNPSIPLPKKKKKKERKNWSGSSSRAPA